MVHLFKRNGYNIALDSNSGSVHDLDEVAWDILSLVKDNFTEKEIISAITKKHTDVTTEDVKETLTEIDSLRNQGMLFSEDDFQDVATKIKAKPPVIKALCLHVAHSCNLACSYCFAGQGKYKGKAALMSFETGKRALDFLIENSGDRHNLEVDFFGGEPLCNFEVVKKLTAYARNIEKQHNKNFRFTLTTNGMLIDDEVIDFCNKEMSNVVLSLDGRKEVNDRFRVTPAGEGSYDKIVPKFQRLVKVRGNKNYYMRGTYTGLNKDFTADILHMADLGFTELSMEPAVTSPDDPVGLKDEDIPFLLEQYDYLGEEMDRRRKAGKPITFYHYMINLQGGPCIYKRVSGCGVGTEYMAVTPAGDLYPCHQFVGDEKFRLGNVFSGIDNPELRQSFRQCNVYSHEECKDCFARFFCSGGCVANAFHRTGSITGVYEFGCKLHRRRIENAIMLKVSENRDKIGCRV